MRSYDGMWLLIIPKRFLCLVTNGSSSIFLVQAILALREEVTWLSTSRSQTAKRTLSSILEIECWGQNSGRPIPWNLYGADSNKAPCQSVFSARFGRMWTMCQPIGQSMLSCMTLLYPWCRVLIVHCSSQRCNTLQIPVSTSYGDKVCLHSPPSWGTTPESTPCGRGFPYTYAHNRSYATPLSSTVAISSSSVASPNITS